MSGYVLADQAARDLDAVLDYIARESSRARAADVLEEFIQSFEKLADFPAMGFRRTGLTGESIRWWPVFRYLVLYRADAQPLTVLRIVHGSRNLESILESWTDR